MAFALLWSHQDMSEMVANVQALESGELQGMSNADRNVARSVWNGGLRNWATAPLAPAPWDAEGSVGPADPDDPNSPIVDTRPRIYVCNTTTTMAAFVAVLRKIAANNPPAWFMESIAFQIVNGSGVEPWPQT